MTKQLSPYFAQYLDENESSTSFLQVQDSQAECLLLIGTNQGRCYCQSLKKLDKLQAIYEDSRNRKIIAMGYWPFPDRQDDVDQEASSSHPIIWLHFRSSTISLFLLRLRPSDGHSSGLSPLRELSTGHYGFCQAIADPLHGRMFIPDHEDQTSILRVHFGNGGEQVIRLDEAFLNTGREDEEEMFKGMLMGIEPGAEEDSVFLAFEDSTVCALNLRARRRKVLDALKHPKHREFLCWATSNLATQTLIAVSVMGQLYLLSHSWAEKSQQPMRAECVVRKCKNDDNCTSIALALADGPSRGEGHRRMAIGLKSGTLLVYLLLPSSSPADGTPPRWSSQLMAQCQNIHSQQIQCLRWIHRSEGNGREEDEVIQMKTTTSSMLLCSGGADEKIAFFELPL